MSNPYPSAHRRMRPVLGLLVLCLLVAACSTTSESGTTAPVDEPATSDVAATTPSSDNSETEVTMAESDYLGTYTLSDEEYGTEVTVTVEGETRTIETNSLPDHETGDFPNSGNPNTITAQDLTYEFTTEPVWSGTASYAQTPGVAVNGIAFEPGTAETLTCDSGETYRIEALQDVYNLGLDFNNAHVQPEGQYHYHGVSQMLVEAYEDDGDLVHVGFASDGYLIYYSKSGAYESSYELSTDARSGTDCVPSGPDPETVDVEGTTPDGTYTSDYVYVEGSGDLDECNGTTVNGDYVYIVTDEYPFIPRCLMGQFSAQGPGGGGPPGAAPGEGGPPQP